MNVVVALDLVDKGVRVRTHAIQLRHVDEQLDQFWKDKEAGNDHCHWSLLDQLLCLLSGMLKCMVPSMNMLAKL